MKIGIDVDNVISDSLPVLLSEANRLFSTDFAYDDIREYNFSKILGISEADMRAFIKKAFDDKVPMRARTIKGAKEAIRKIKETYEIHIVTARPKGYEADTLEWLNKNDIPFDFLEHATEKQKHIYAVQNGIKTFVEDDMDEAVSLILNDIKVFLFDRPWNRTSSNNNGYLRVKGWDEILNNL
ncbi:MAG: hypothetical protein NT030_02200 [Candidatus Saganbacteria bacterium]|nr:hypothetical protein [Candidatus Saganbacteria bacterium]